MTWPITASSTVYQNPWISVVEDTVVRPDGTSGIYGVVEMRNPAVFVVAVTDDRKILLVTLDRHTVGTSIEVPAGGTDGEDPLVAAQRELLEETGFVAHNWKKIGRMSALNGICRASEFVFLATGLTQPEAEKNAHEAAVAAEGISAVRAVPIAEVYELVRAGEISDGETVAALMYAALDLGLLGRGD